MKLTTCILLIISSLHFSANSQIFVGLKGGYNRYFDPGMNGGNISIFTEIPLGEEYGTSIRTGIFYDFPMKTQDMGLLYAYDNQSFDDDRVPVLSTYKNAGISLEYIFYFYDDAFSTGFYAMGKGGLSFSTITRKVGDFDATNYYLNDLVKDNRQISVYFGIGAGFQVSLGVNSLIFTEIHGGFPFLLTRGDDAGSSSISGYPVATVSGIIGFKQSIFN